LFNLSLELEKGFPPGLMPPDGCDGVRRNERTASPCKGERADDEVLLPDLERAERIGVLWSYPQSRTFAELLMHCERIGRSGTALVGMLRE
jgi:hypothetical protein